jgi:hypothetical protein
MLWPTCPRNAEHASVPDGRNSRVNSGGVASHPVGTQVQIIQNGRQSWIGRVFSPDLITLQQQDTTHHTETLLRDRSNDDIFGRTVDRSRQAHVDRDGRAQFWKTARVTIGGGCGTARCSRTIAKSVPSIIGFNPCGRDSNREWYKRP